MTLASYITLTRIFLIIPIIILTSFQKVELNAIALLLFIIAGFTDYLDGYIARRTNTVSQLGALLDLTADKLLVCVTLVWLINLNNTILFIIPVLIIILRELTISSVRQFIVELKGVNELSVSSIAKGKTTLQLISIALIIISPGLGIYLENVALSALWIASFVSLYSLSVYLFSWIKTL